MISCLGTLELCPVAAVPGGLVGGAIGGVGGLLYGLITGNGIGIDELYDITNSAIQQVG